MASYFDEIARNRAKSILLMLVFSLFFAAIVYLFVGLLGGGLVAFAFGLLLILIYALISYHFGANFVLYVSRAKEADKRQYLVLYDIVGGLASATQLPMPKIYVMNDPNPNAFATGKNKKSSYVCVTTGLLSIMNREELEGVLAHEMSHVYNNDIQFEMLAVVFAGVIGLIAAFIRNMIFWGGMFGRDDRRGGNGIIFIVAFVIGLLAPLFALLIRLAISRNREYMADANGARITRDPKALADALTKIQKYDANPDARGVMHANEITSPIYFSNPFNAKSLFNLFSTHPPIEERIRRLRQMY